MKVLCKKTLILIDREAYTAGVWYNVIRKGKKYMSIKTNLGCKDMWDTIRVDFKENFSKYFYTTKELRKEKLNKINEL
jgi:hypothetical protein